MRRIAIAFLAALTLLGGSALAAPVGAAKPVEATATVAIDDPTPEYGQTVILTATIDFGTADEPAQIRTSCVHEFGASFGFSSIRHWTTITDDVGLYAPNWPEAPATCTANVVLWRVHGKEQVIGSLTFEVAA